ncbi:MAG: hypothetical protein AAB393_16580, partial [Bacteroidota bacterium]
AIGTVMIAGNIDVKTLGIRYLSPEWNFLPRYIRDEGTDPYVYAWNRLWSQQRAASPDAAPYVGGGLTVSAVMAGGLGVYAMPEALPAIWGALSPSQKAQILAMMVTAMQLATGSGAGHAIEKFPNMQRAVSQTIELFIGTKKSGR